VKPRAVVEPDKRSAWLRKLDEECPYQVALPRQQLTNDSEILDFLLAHVGWTTCMSRTITPPSCAIALPTHSTPKFSARASSRRPSASGSPDKRPRSTAQSLFRYRSGGQTRQREGSMLRRVIAFAAVLMAGQYSSVPRIPCVPKRPTPIVPSRRSRTSGPFARFGARDMSTASIAWPM